MRKSFGILLMAAALYVFGIGMEWWSEFLGLPFDPFWPLAGLVALSLVLDFALRRHSLKAENANG